jgi:hypothetical protein
MMHLVYERMNRTSTGWGFISYEKLRVDKIISRVLRMDGNSFPFSFCERGMPNKLSTSNQLESVFKTMINPTHCSWLLKADLLRKASELLVTPDQYALEALPSLKHFINRFPATEGPPQFERVVFWWADKTLPVVKLPEPLEQFTGLFPRKTNV